MILPRTKLGPHRRHFFQLENAGGIRYTHVMLTIYPDGGVKRVRVIGTWGTGTSSESRALTISEEETLKTDSAQGESRQAQALRWMRFVY
jgi:allantoicase